MIGAELSSSLFSMERNRSTSKCESGAYRACSPLIQIHGGGYRLSAIRGSDGRGRNSLPPFQSPTRFGLLSEMDGISFIVGGAFVRVMITFRFLCRDSVGSRWESEKAGSKM